MNAVDIERAGAELSDRRVPALESLGLRQALIEALESAGQPQAAATQAALLASHRDRLLKSLAAAPEHMAMFARTMAAEVAEVAERSVLPGDGDVCAGRG